MFKLSKESKYVFGALLVVPIIWVSLNQVGYLDYLKIKSVDLRKQYRGEIPQDSSINIDKTVVVENNKTIPLIPIVTYVNFDAGTLAMDGVGERPWDRAFFRDTALTLLEKGKARALGFDFGFTPKSMSKMVPKVNSYRSDKAMGQLVDKFPNQVVLGCLYSGVQTPFVKDAGASAFPPIFSEGYEFASNNYYYPESPTYPLQNYKNGKYIGRLGSFTVPPFRAVDEIPRWVPLWFKGGGKAHAYNLLGGKQNILKIELENENMEAIQEAEKNLSVILKRKSNLAVLEDRSASELEKINQKRNADESAHEKLLLMEAEFNRLSEEISMLRNTLKTAPGLASTLDAQINDRESARDRICRQVLSDDLGDGKEEFSKITEIEKELSELAETIHNFENTLEANPSLSAVIKPQLLSRVERQNELRKTFTKLSKPVTEADRNKSKNLITHQISKLNEAKQSILPQLALKANELNGIREKLSSLENEERRANMLLSKLSGEAETELVETNNTLRLVYKRGDGNSSLGELVYSQPNEVPLEKSSRFFTLGLEVLLAYYGVGDEQVEITKNREYLIVRDLSGEILFEAPLTEGQWLEVNWFSSWSHLSSQEELIRETKKYYADGDFESYASSISSIFLALLEQVEGLDLPQNKNEIIQTIIELGVEPYAVEIAQKLLLIPPHKIGAIPGYDELVKVLDEIGYYVIPSSIKSNFNPMCGMNDILNYGQFHDQVSENLTKVKNLISMIQGPDYLGKINSLLKENPSDENYLAQQEKFLDALKKNEKVLAEQEEEMARIESFFSTFNNAIVLIGPEEATFQDLAPTPFDKSSVPKVSVHGNLIKTLTNQEYLHRLPLKVDHVATLGVCILMALLAVYQGKRASIVQGCGILLLLGYVFLGFETFSQSHIIWPITAPACAGLSTSFIGLAAMVVIEQKAKGRLKGMFGSYVSSDLVEQMVESGKEPSLGGEETPITAFFSDVQSFSSFSELLTPTGLVDLMNEYLTAMTNILQEERGTLDKYIGDAIVAMYGAPIPMQDHAYQAVRTAILMQQKQIELREKWVHEAEKWGKCHGLVSQMQTRIGCNTGTATVGNMGALDRFNYTMMGDMVNLAARCESGAKAYGAYIMVTEETKLASEQTRQDIAYRYLDKIVVKGRSQPVAMFEPTGFLSELSQETQDCLDCFGQGIEKYLLQDWEGALNLFEKAKGLEPNKPGVTPGVKDNPSMILIDRCKVMKENPPGDDWDGVYVMTTK